MVEQRRSSSKCTRDCIAGRGVEREGAEVLNHHEISAGKDGMQEFFIGWGRHYTGHIGACCQPGVDHVCNPGPGQSRH